MTGALASKLTYSVWLVAEALPAASIWRTVTALLPARSAASALSVNSPLTDNSTLAPFSLATCIWHRRDRRSSARIPVSFSSASLGVSGAMASIATVCSSTAVLPAASLTRTVTATAVALTAGSWAELIQGDQLPYHSTIHGMPVAVPMSMTTGR